MTVHTTGTRMGPDADVQIALPPASQTLEQDEEWCHVRNGSEWRRIRLHDYDEIFSIPGLYEKLVYEILGCDSPKVVVSLLKQELAKRHALAGDLRVLDLGAGNGMVGEQLTCAGVETVVGLDISQAAAEATDRDRPGVYTEYHVLDLTRMDASTRRRLAGEGFDCLTCVAALGFGDIPVEAFAEAYDMVTPGGWVAFNIKRSFIQQESGSGFARLIGSEIAQGGLDLCRKLIYQHRLGMDGRSIKYAAMVGIKRRDMDPGLRPG